MQHLSYQRVWEGLGVVYFDLNITGCLWYSKWYGSYTRQQQQQSTLNHKLIYFSLSRMVSQTWPISDLAVDLADISDLDDFRLGRFQTWPILQTWTISDLADTSDLAAPRFQTYISSMQHVLHCLS